MEPLAVRVPEAATILSLARSTIYELIRDGQLPSIHVGKATLVPVSALKEFVERRATTK